MDRMKPATPFLSPSSSCDHGRNGGSAAGFLSRILRRILSLPLCSFDHFEVEEREVVVGAPGATPPGVVARLMGLDSLPLVEERPLSSGFKASHQRRRIPAYQELEDDNFIILSFEKRSRRRRRKQEQSKREKSCRRSRKNENRGNLLPLLAKQDGFGNIDDSENSSPNSVLEFLGISADQEYADSQAVGEISRLANSKMRRPLSEELDSCGDSGQEGGNLVKLRLNDAGKLDQEVGKLAAVETTRSSLLHDEMWDNRHCLKEIGRDIASNIVDHLMEDLLIDLQQF